MSVEAPGGLEISLLLSHRLHLSLLTPKIVEYDEKSDLVFLDESFYLVRDTLGKVMNAELVIFTFKPRTGKVSVLSQCCLQAGTERVSVQLSFQTALLEQGEKGIYQKV